MNAINSHEDVRKVLLDCGEIVGLGVTAFPRVGINSLVDDYQILCIRESTDLDLIRKKIKVLSVKKDFGGVSVEKLNTLALLRLKPVQDYLSSLGKEKAVFVYKSSKRIEKIVDQLGLKLLSNRSEVRDVFEDKWEFRKIGARAGLEMISGEQLKIDDLTKEAFLNLQEKLGKKLVLQITDYSKGGGIGTFFVSNENDLGEFQGFVGRRREAGRDLRKVNVTRFIEGESASVTGCVTRHGILTSLVQRQIIDIPQVVGYKGRSGVFCGHDWGERYSDKIYRGARSLTSRLGEYMYGKGYKGVFGVDLVVNHETGEVRIVECNPRYTAPFPVYSMLQEEAGEIPMDAWHLLEFSGKEYEMDFGKTQKRLEQEKTGAQLILHNLERAWVAVRGEVKAGVYRMTGVDPVSLEWVKDGFSIEDIKNENEFVLTDGVPYKNLRLKPGARLGRVMFKRTVMEEAEDRLKPEIRDAMVALYSLFKLEKIKRK